MGTSSKQADSPFPPRPDKRSPFPRPSLPQAGESLGERMMDLIVDRVLIYAIMGITLCMVALTEWAVLLFTRERPTLILWPLFAVGLCVLAVWRWFRIRPILAALRLGRRGEREVGRMLEDLRRLGYAVFHDIPGDGFNVDHALIGPGGVFAIETKTRSKPAGRKAIVKYDGKRCLVDGNELSDDPLAQAEACARHLAEILSRKTDRRVGVHPIVVFPGWWVDDPQRNWPVWILNPERLGRFLRGEPTRLKPDDIALFRETLTLHLSAE